MPPASSKPFCETSRPGHRTGSWQGIWEHIIYGCCSKFLFWDLANFSEKNVILSHLLSRNFRGAYFHMWVNLGHQLGYQHLKQLIVCFGLHMGVIRFAKSKVPFANHLTLLNDTAITHLSQKKCNPFAKLSRVL